MFRSARFAFLLVFFATSLFSAFVPAAQPKIVVVEGALEKDFGNVRRQQRLTARVFLENQGDAEAVLEKVQKGCDRCAEMRLSRKRLAPNGRCEILLRYDTESKLGRQIRRAFIKTNDPTSPTLALLTHWTAVAALDVRPDEIDFGLKPCTATQGMKISLVLDGIEREVKVTKLEATSPHLKVAEPKLVRTKDGKRIDIGFYILPTAPIGDFAAEVRMETDYEKEPRIVVPVRGKIQGAFGCEPVYVNFGKVARGEGASHETRIVANQGERFRIIETEFDTKRLACRVEKNAGGGYTLKINLLPHTADETLRTTITLQTNCPSQKTIAIPVLAVVKGEKTVSTPAGR